MKYRLFYSIIILLLLVSTTVFCSSITYEYDELDRLHLVTLENGQKITYEYDEIGNMISKTPSGNVVTISATAADNGSIYPKGSTVITVGGSKTYSITPSSGYKIANVSVDGVAKGAISSYTFADLATNHSIIANFAINTYAVTFAAGSGGTLTGTASQTVNYNNSATAVTAVPATGFRFVSWTGTGGFVTTRDNPLTVSHVTATQNIAASFAPVLNISDTGSIIQSTSGTYTHTFTSNATVTVSSLNGGGGGGGGWDDSYSGGTSAITYWTLELQRHLSAVKAGCVAVI